MLYEPGGADLVNFSEELIDHAYLASIRRQDHPEVSSIVLPHKFVSVLLGTGQQSRLYHSNYVLTCGRIGTGDYSARLCKN